MVILTFTTKIHFDDVPAPEKLSELKDTLEVALRTICYDNLEALDIPTHAGSVTVVPR